MKIRKVDISDAENLVNLILQVEKESEYMLMEPGERQLTVEQQAQRIKSFQKSHNSTIFVAEKESQLVGYLFAVGGSAKRTAHSVYLVIGILKDFRGLGIGTSLFQQLERWAVAHSIHRLELTVVTRNEAGIALYKKMGFEIEGKKQNSLLINSEFVDEYYMAKLIQGDSDGNLK
ncbi:GNAT family N-acetyltransferase [Neobacillus mesonae]|uniref:GNAT family N-acetyltransferase n=1 Tax=Neobacillus mesonae TaxID=1193713 RepID=A0A3Q9QRN6_9BACI|nr:GNAT family N-acetyltransferase [Neobacillus mesonae]AZU60665.1 GNAT family N-acetyltransferase [Neobacillus mesonae]